MRHSALLVVALLVIGFVAPASGQIRVGLVSGASLSDYRSDDNAEHSMRTGLAVGGVVDFHLNDRFGLRLEPMYIQKGGTGEDASVQETATLESSMIELPVFATLEWGEETRPYLLAGPTVAVMLASDLKGEISGIPVQGDMMDVTERFELGFGVGGGLSHSFDRVDVFIEGRYAWGISDMMKGGQVELYNASLSIPVDFDDDDDWYKYQGAQILAGFTVPVG
ncbi:porin family protein [Gemmatimonadota bacterium]